MRLTGTPSDDLPAVLATGGTDVHSIFISMSARESDGRDAQYLEWHSLDHRPEQHRVAGVRHSIRLVSTPACRSARARSDASFDGVDHVMTYFFAKDAAYEQFRALSVALSGERRPFRLPSVFAAYLSLSGKIASRHAVIGADVLPWRPAHGVYLLIERDAHDPIALANFDGVAGVWWFRGGGSPEPGHSETVRLQVSYCFLDGDPVETARRLRPSLEQRWANGGGTPLFAAPFQTLIPFEWDRYLP